jgi:hypothetical protein
VLTHEHGERCIGVIPQKEPYFLPTIRRTGRREVKVGINYVPKSDKDIRTAVFVLRPCWSHVRKK